MKNKQTLIVFVLFFFIPQATLFAQRNGLIGSNNKKGTGSLVITMGPSYCFGDLGGSTKTNPSVFDDINLENLRYALSLGFRQSFDNRLGYRISLHQGLYASKDRGSLADRGLETNSNIIELTALAEFNILQGFLGRLPSRLYLYGGGGLAYAFIDMKGKAVSAPTESKTSVFAPVIPFGVGFDMWTTSRLALGLETTWQYAFSDFMDGVKTGGTNSKNDILANISFTLSYKIFGGGQQRGKSGCNCM